MPIAESALTGVERTFDPDQFIVSKTDLKGRITYANKVFLDIADYTEAEILGQPHSVIRHAHMPRCVFRLLWERIQTGREIFAYVVNAAKNGDHYWVLAHVGGPVLPVCFVVADSRECCAAAEALSFPCRAPSF